MLIFDSHTHIFPDKVAERALEHLRHLAHELPTFTQGTAVSQEATAFRYGYTGWMNCPVVTNEHQMRSVNDWVAGLNHWPHLSLGGIFPNAPMAVVLEEIHRIKKLGLYGIKFHPEYQGFRPLDPKFDPMWQAMRDEELPAFFHAGADVAYFSQEQNSWPADFARLAERIPGLTIVCAHLGGWLNWDLVESDLCGAPVYLDTAFAKCWMPDQEQYERIIRKHGVDKVLFGTDSPWNPLDSAVRELQETSLSDVEKHQIFWSNAAKLWHLPTMEWGNVASSETITYSK